VNDPVWMARKIEMWPVDRLKPYERNPRKHDDDQVERIAASIVERGFTNPILVDGDDGIIAGHGRLLAARRLGLREVPVIELTHLTPGQRRAYVIADNKLALDARWDGALLLEEVAALREHEVDEASAGFTDEELAAIEANLGSGAGGTEAYRPNLDPVTELRTVDQEDVEAARAMMDDRLHQPDGLARVMCPRCASEFFINPSSLK